MGDRIAPTDPVEAQMGEGAVVRREKVISRQLALICLLLFLAFGAVSIAYLQGWAADRPAFFRWLTYALVPFFAWIGLTKTVLRTLVTTGEVHVQQGLRGARIPVASITSCRVDGGERPEGGTELYCPAGRKGVLVRWQGEKSKERKALIGSDDPAALVAAIERARGAGAEKMRVEAALPIETGVNERAEDEAAAESKRAERERGAR